MAREDPLAVETSFDGSLLLFRCRTVWVLFWFRRSEFEIGICIEIGILPEPSEQIIILKKILGILETPMTNDDDSRNGA